MAKKKHRAQQASSAVTPHRRATIAAVALMVVALGAMLVPPVPNRALGMDLIALWTGLAGVIAAIALLMRRVTPWPRSRVASAWSAFMAWAFLCTLVSGRAWAALVGEPTNRLGWMTLIALSLVALAGASSAGEVSALLRRHAWWVVVAESLFTMYRLVTTNSATVGGTLPNSTYLGEAFVLLLPWVLPDESVTNARDRRTRYVVIVLAVAVLGAVQSRAALIVAGLWCMWAIARYWKAPAVYKVAASLALVTIAVGATVTVLPASVFDPDGSLPFGGRFAAWELSARALAERPVVGWGPDSYWPAAAAVRTPEVAAAGASLALGEAATDPHNAIVWVALSTGVVGLGLFLWFVVSIVLEWRRRMQTDTDIVPALWSLGGCLALGLIAPLTLHILPLFALVLGVSLKVLAAEADDPASQAARKDQTLGLVLVLLLAVTSGVLALNAATRASYEITTAENSPRLAAGARTASALWFADPHLAYLSSLHAGWAAQASPDAGWQQVDLAALDRAVKVDTRNPFYALERARAMNHYGLDPASVDVAYREAFARYPAYPRARAEYAVYLATNGRIAEAREQLRLNMTIADGDTGRVQSIQDAESAIASGTP